MCTMEAFAPLLRTHAQGGGARHVVITKEMAHTIEGERLLLVIVLPGTIFKTTKIVHEVMAQHFVNLFIYEEAADVLQQLKADAGVLGGSMSIKDPAQGQTRPSRPFPANGMSDSEQGQCTFVLAHREPRNIRDGQL